MMPGALTSTRMRVVGLDRALAVDRVAERVDDAAEQALADGGVHDRAGALDRLAFLDVAVGAEDHDADIVGLEVQGHAAHAVLELDHLARLDVVEPVGAGDAVTDGQHLADLGDLGLGPEILDLVLEDRGDFCGADIHQPTSFIAVRMPLSLVRRDASTMRGAELHHDTADDGRVDLHFDRDVLTGHVLESLPDVAEHLARTAFRRAVTWARTMPRDLSTSAR